MGIYSEPHICHCLSRLATIRRHAPVIISGNRRKTGEQFVEEVLSLARGLSDLGLKPGDIVAISALNSDLYLEWLLAVAFVGGIVAPLNYRWSLEEARLATEVVKPAMLVTDTSYNYWHTKFEVSSAPYLRWHVFMNQPIKSKNKALTTEMLKKPSLRPHSFNYFCAPDGVAIICFTSGTTGKPKGVTLTHSALIIQSLAKITVVGYGEDDVYLHTTPLCHIGGLSSAMAILMVGGCHILAPKFEAKSALEAIEKHQVTSLITVPTIMADLITIVRSKKTIKELVTVKKILNGGGGLQIDLIKDAMRFFQSAKLLSAYGMTEACSSITFEILYDPTREKSGLPQENIVTKTPSVHQSNGFCVGKPAPHVEVKISVEGSSNAGRILTRGPHVMLGYWGQEHVVKASNHDDEGWLDTGDVGRIDDYGNLWLIGRSKGRIKSGGENVYPEEVEAVLLKHPGILKTIVTGIPDTRLTEMVVACIQIKDNWTWNEFESDHFTKENNQLLSHEILLHFCREQNLTGFKIPKKLIIWKKQFPLTTTGKVRRDEVRKEVLSHLQLLNSNL